MPELKRLSQNIRRYRKEQHLSQEEMAWQCGIGELSLRAIEREKANPRLDTLQKIAAFTDKTVADLLS